MKIGILDLLCEDAQGSLARMPHDYAVVKQYAGIMPQAVSVWCRNLGHQAFYTTYYGQKDPLKLLPNDLDAVFFPAFPGAAD